MRRRVQLQLLSLSLSVAAVAATTAWLVTGTTATRGSEVPASNGPTLWTDLEIHNALFTYANEHRSWDGVESLVLQLAESSGRRIALTTPDGDVIADSALLRGNGSTELPSTPTSRVDAVAPPTQGTTPQPNIVAGEPGQDLALSWYQWQPTEQELHQRQELADQAVDCLLRTRPSHRSGEPRRVQVSADAAGTPFAATEATSALVPDSCVPAALWEPTAATRDLHERIVEETMACLDDHAVAYDVSIDSRGMRTLRSTQEGSAEWTACARSARAEAKRPFVAAPADLYIGESYEPDTSSSVRWRPAAAIATILITATVPAILAGRRFVRPLRSLTSAAERVAAGDHPVHVEVRGPYEMAKLATAFNVMADAVASNEQRHRALIDDVAHELRNPLTNVRGQLEAARDGVLPLDPPLISSLIEESSLLERLVADLRNLGTAGDIMFAVHREEWDVAVLVEQVVAAHRTRAERSGVDLQLTIDDSGSPVRVRADPMRLRQVLNNLVSNAVRHTPAGGSVRITVGRAAGSVMLAVADSGSGVAAEHLPHIFERHYRGDPPPDGATAAAAGAGLGLAIARNLVEAHDGRIDVVSTPGAGSVFAIRLPNPGSDQQL